MRPKTLSASSLETASLCLARYKAENIEFTPNIDGIPAMTGTTVHYACEHMVRAVYLDKIHGWVWDKMLAYYQLGYIETFGSADYNTDHYKDGLEMAERWFKRTDLSNVKIVEVETKKRFPLRINDDITIPITYIFDRLDQLSENVYKVVDYKSIRAFIPATDLKKKIQPRIYALAVQLEHPECEKVWVEFDMFRHEPIGVSFTKEENRATLLYLKQEAVRILNTPDENPPESLNPVCGYCVRKSQCETLTKHVLGGGILGLTPVEAARKKAEVANALKALNILDGQLDELLVAESKAQDAFSFELMDGETPLTVEISAKKQRSPNVSEIRRIIGAELVSEYGNITMTAVDKMLKSDDLTPEQKKEVKSMISSSFGKTTTKVTTPSPLGDL